MQSQPVPVPVRGTAFLAGCGLAVGGVSLVLLQALPTGGQLVPVSAPLSQYVFAPDGWLFDLSILALAFGLAVLVSALVRARCIVGRSAACTLLSVSVLGLVAVVVFPEHDQAGAVRTAGYIHWVATMLTFGGLSVVPALVGRHGVSPRCARMTSWTRRISAGAGPCFLLVAAADLLHYRTPLPVPVWWFGVGERVLVVLEMTMAAVLTAWAWHGCACGPATRSPGRAR